MICSICNKEMGISDGMAEMDGKRCHESCKQEMEKKWRKDQGLDRY